MSMITTKDGTQIYYKDWGTGQPVVFSHGWPLSADAWEDQMVFLGAHGYRCIAHDRRGHGRSSQPWNGNDMDTYADDLAALTEKLNLKDAVHVGHSTDRGVQPDTRGRPGRPFAVLEGSQPAVLRLQQARGQDFGGRARVLLAPGDDGRPPCLVLLHQGVLRDRSHRGPQEDRRADAGPARRRRSDRPDRRFRPAVGEG